MKLNLSNTKNESKNVQSAQVTNNAAAIADPIEDAVIVSEESSPTTESKRGKTKGGSKKSPKSNKNPQPSTLDPQFSVVTYTTKKGGTACYIAGFKTEAEAKALADQLPHSVSNSYRYDDKGQKVYIVSFGTRYLLDANALCEGLNEGNEEYIHASIAGCHCTYKNAVAAGKAERERKSEERKAEREKKKADEAKAKADQLEAIKKENGLMSREEVAALMQRVVAGDAAALEEVNKMMAKVA